VGRLVLVLVLRLGLGLALGLHLGIGIGFRRNHSWSSTFTPGPYKTRIGPHRRIGADVVRGWYGGAGGPMRVF